MVSISKKKSSIYYILILSILTLVFQQDNLKSDDYDELRHHSKAVMLTHYHDILKSFEGKYRVIFFFTPPEARAAKGSGSSTNTIVLKERYLEMDSDLIFGSEVLGRKIIIGYDGMKGKYQLTQYTDLETYTLNAEGNYDDVNKKLIFEGSYPHPELNSNKFKIVFEYVNQDEFKYLFYEIEKAKETLVLDVRYIKLSN